MKLDAKVQRILQWRESFCTLPDKFFFEIVRIYLGEVKTPYNKQKLAEDIASFLRRKETREMIVKFLDSADIKILTAVKFLNDPDVEKLEKFFSSSVQQGKFYSAVASLEERLLIFTVCGKNSKKIIKINPYLEDDLDGILNLQNLISPEKSKKISGKRLRISAEVIAAFVCYVSSHSDVCKNSGELKKKASCDLAEIFQEDFSKEFFETLFKALKNLHIIQEAPEEKSLFVDWQRLELFSGLSFENQSAYICAACAGSFSRSVILSNAEIFFKTISFLKHETYTRQKILQIAFLLKDRNFSCAENSVSRFSRIIAAGSSAENSSVDSGFLDVMLDCAVELGILDSVFEGENEFICVNQFFGEKKAPGVLSIDAGFSVTVFPGFLLSELVPLIKFLCIKKCAPAAVFEITRRSVLKSFDFGMTKERIAAVLEKYSHYEIPQNLLISLDEWADSYNSASLYKGYILKIRPENSIVIEKKLSSYIAEILSPGIFLMDFVSDEQARICVEKLGLDFVGNVKSARKALPAAGFPEFSFDSKNLPWSLENFSSENSMACGSKKEVSKILGDLKIQLENIPASSEQKEGLEERIKRRVVLSPDQLRPESVKFELTEASGMNFTGKLRILESAVQTGDLVELEMSTTKEILIGVPRAVVKNQIVFLVCKNPETNSVEEYEILIALISKVKKIRSSASVLNLVAKGS